MHICLQWSSIKTCLEDIHYQQNIFLHQHFMRKIISIAVSFNYFEFQKYCSVEIVEEMRLVIFGKNQLRKNWYLISLKRIFLTGICYLLIFTSEEHIPKNGDFLPFQISNFFFIFLLLIWLAENQSKVRNHNSDISERFS